MKLKIVKYTPGQFLEFKGRPSIGSYIFFLIFAGVLFFLILFKMNDFLVFFSVSILCLLFLFIIYSGFIEFRVVNQKGIFLKTGFKKQDLVWSNFKKFRTYLTERTAKGTTVVTADITVFDNENEINIFHAAFGGWDKEGLRVWHEVGQALASFGLEYENFLEVKNPAKTTVIKT